MRVDKYIDGANEQRKYIDGDDGNWTFHAFLYYRQLMQLSNMRATVQCK